MSSVHVAGQTREALIPMTIKQLMRFAEPGIREWLRETTSREGPVQITTVEVSSDNASQELLLKVGLQVLHHQKVLLRCPMPPHEGKSHGKPIKYLAFDEGTEGYDLIRSEMIYEKDIVELAEKSYRVVDTGILTGFVDQALLFVEDL